MDSIWIHTGATVINSFSELYGCIPVVSVQFFCPPEKKHKPEAKLGHTLVWAMCTWSVLLQCPNAVQNTSNYVHCVPPES